MLSVARGLARHLLAVLLLSASLATQAMAQPQQQAADNAQLFPRVETGLHEADINALVAIPGTSTVITASDDKSARLWSADDFTPRGIVRPPVGGGDNGKVYAVAATSKLIAVAGALGDNASTFRVALFALPDLRPLGVFRGMQRTTAVLRFSPDGRTLAAGQTNGGGLWLFDMQSSTGPSVQVIPYKGDVAALDFSADGRMLVTGPDDGIRLYSPDRRLLDHQSPPDQAPFGSAFSPDGHSVVVGDRNRTVAYVYSITAAGKLTKRRDLAGAPQSLGAMERVAFSPDGSVIYGAGAYRNTQDERLLRRWTAAGRALPDIPVATDTVTALLPQDDGVLFATGEPTLGRVDAEGRVLRIRSPHADFRSADAASFRLSADGSVVEMPIGQPQLGSKPNVANVLFDIRAHAILSPGAAAPPLLPATTSAPGLTVRDWKNQPALLVNGRLISMEKPELVRSVAVAQDGSAVALGTDFYVRYVLAGGSEAWDVVTAAPAWAVNVSQDGNLVVAGLGDGSVHWYDARDGHELLALYVDPPTQRFVMWTPDGFFDHDHRTDGQPDGRDLIGYLYDQPNGRNSTFVDVGQMYKRFFRPDLVGMSLRDDAVAKSVIQDQVQHVGTVTSLLSKGLPANVSLIDSCGRDASTKASGCPGTRSLDTRPQGAGMTLSTVADSVLVEYKLTNPTGAPGHVVIRRNGAVLQPNIFVDDEDDHTRSEEAVVPLGDGENDIQLQPVTSDGDLQAADQAALNLNVTRSVPAPAAAQQAAAPQTPARPHTTLYLLSIGVSNFTEPKLNLANASRDAAAVTALMNAPDPPVYDAVVPNQLLDGQATSAAIMAALNSIAKDATPNDMVIIFLAGHGEAVDGRYYFAPSDLGTGDEALFAAAVSSSGGANQNQAVSELFRKEGLSQDDILSAIQRIKAGRVALILDTCYSASIATADAVARKDLNSTVTNAIGQAAGRFVLSSAITLAFDSADSGGGDAPGGHGLFTSYLLKALTGAADFNHNGTIDTYKLAVFTQDGVEKATATMNQEQAPEYFFSGNKFFALRTVPPSAAN